MMSIIRKILIVPATIYYSDEESCYIDMGEEEGIHAGDYLIKPGSQDRYQVGQTGSLQGVYNINKGEKFDCEFLTTTFMFQKQRIVQK